MKNNLKYKKILLISLISIFLILISSVLAISNKDKVRLTLEFILNNYKEECLQYDYIQTPMIEWSCSYWSDHYPSDYKSFNKSEIELYYNKKLCYTSPKYKRVLVEEQGRCIKYHLVRKT